MPLNAPAGTACFVDANIFYYHFVDVPLLSDGCSEFLARVTRQEVTAFASVHVLAEAVHKVMLAEAAAKFAMNRAGLVNWLQHHRDRIQQLSDFCDAARDLLSMPLSLVPADASVLDAATALSRQFGLLTNDALILALMRRQGLQHLVTNDDDFDGIAGLTVWKPR
jgi:predicted nucleic acid-binding protein